MTKSYILLILLILLLQGCAPKTDIKECAFSARVFDKSTNKPLANFQLSDSIITDKHGSFYLDQTTSLSLGVIGSSYNSFTNSRSIEFELYGNKIECRCINYNYGCGDICLSNQFYIDTERKSFSYSPNLNLPYQFENDDTKFIDKYSDIQNDLPEFEFYCRNISKDTHLSVSKQMDISKSAIVIIDKETNIKQNFNQTISKIISNRFYEILKEKSFIDNNGQISYIFFNSIDSIIEKTPIENSYILKSDRYDNLVTLIYPKTRIAQYLEISLKKFQINYEKFNSKYKDSLDIIYKDIIDYLKKDINDI